MNAFFRRIDRESNRAEALKKERVAFARRELAVEHKPGDGCIENE